MMQYDILLTPEQRDEKARLVHEAVGLGRFDIDSDTDDTRDAGWLDVTHTLTYVNALRWAWSVNPGPVVLRGVLHAAREELQRRRGGP